MVAQVRADAPNGLADYSDAQIWQAILDSRDWEVGISLGARGKLAEHVIEGRVAPTCAHYPKAAE